MGTIVTTPAVSRPISVVETKAHLRLEHNDEDDYIVALIGAATDWAQHFCNRYFMTTSVDCLLDDFPPRSIWLAASPIQTVDSVQYTDDSSAVVTLDPSTYVLDLSQEPAILNPAIDKEWPKNVHSEATNAVRISITAGYGNLARQVPQSIRHGIKMLIGHWYENRQSVEVLERAARVGEIPQTAKMLLYPYRVLTAGVMSG